MRGLNPLLKHWKAWGAKAVVAAGFATLVLVLMLWLAGRFSPKVPSAARPTGPAVPAAVPTLATATVRLVRLPITETAVGSIKAIYETSVASRLAARVVEVNLKAGQRVKTGDVLVRLDDSDLRARLKQAQAEVDRARAVKAIAESELRRITPLRKQNAASANEFERAETAVKTADADLERAGQAVREAESLLEYATVKAPLDGIVVDKKVDVGDTALPGQVMARVYDPNSMQLVASVRESLTQRLRVGQPIGVRVDVLAKTCEGRVAEIVPESETGSRTFQVKVSGPCPPGIYSGMFGRILIPLDEEEVLVVPREAVRRVGQLELVEVADAGRVQRRSVRTGRVIAGQFEVLSGLRPGEQVVVPESAGAPDAGKATPNTEQGA
jgi:membrane fusion protein, multidrug efflux system